MTRTLVSSAQDKLNHFKTEVAREMGVHFSNYNGSLTSKECGSVGGEMVKRMVQDFETRISDTEQE